MVTFFKTNFVALLMVLFLACSNKEDHDFDIKLIAQNPDSQQKRGYRIFASLCNKSDRNLYLPNFYSIWQQINIVKLDTVGKYADFRLELSSFRMIRDSAQHKANFKALQKDPKWNNGDRFDLSFLFKDHFADSVALTLSKKALEGSADKIVGKNPRADYYFYLESIGYVKAGACLCDTIDLSDLNYYKGDFKIWFSYKGIRIPSEGGREAYNYFEMSTPEKLKGHNRWRGDIKSDTLDLKIE